MKIFEKIETPERIYGSVIEFFIDTNEQSAVENNYTDHEIYKKYKLRDKIYMIRVSCKFDTSILYKNNEYLCNLSIDSYKNICINEIITDKSDFVDEEIKLTEYKYNDIQENDICMYIYKKNN